MRNFACSFFLPVFFIGICLNTAAQGHSHVLPVRGFAIAAPVEATLDSFLAFINDELAPRKVNTLILRIDYKYRYKSHPELIDSGALSNEQVKSIVKICKQNKIKIIPQVNLLGHQSWAGHTGKLLQVYPQFDETPGVLMPEKYEWPNADSLYCKSYCPLHPDLHKVLFDIVDEICDVFEADAFHAGMDEVFYIGDDKCPRCAGRSKAELFAGEVTTIYNHLAQTKRELWIWGDRLLDGNTMSLGMWEGSMNNTHPAIDLIPKKVVICDWHYDRVDKTAALFASKGFKVITCSWRNPDVAVSQVNDMVAMRSQSSTKIRPRYAGMMATVWSSVSNFLNGFYSKQESTSPEDQLTDWNTFRIMYEHINKLSENK